MRSIFKNVALTGPVQPTYITGMKFDLDRYDHLLLDMNGTFVLDFDRFDSEQNFGATYQSLGYQSLAPNSAHHRVRKAYDYMAARYPDEAYYANFPSVAEALVKTSTDVLAAEVVDELVATFAAHELGVLPPGYKAALKNLSARKPLSVLSNLWAPKNRWLEQFAQWGISGCFHSLHFSSDGAEIKPHPAFFNRALQPIRQGNPAARVLYVGDSYRCDVRGAVAAGIDVVWLSTEDSARRTEGQPVAKFANLLEFEAAVNIQG